MKLQDRGTKASAPKAPPGLTLTVVPIALGLFTATDQDGTIYYSTDQEGTKLIDESAAMDMIDQVMMRGGRTPDGAINRFQTSFEADDAPVVIKDRAVSPLPILATGEADTTIEEEARKDIQVQAEGMLSSTVLGKCGPQDCRVF